MEDVLLSEESQLTSNDFDRNISADDKSRHSTVRTVSADERSRRGVESKMEDRSRPPSTRSKTTLSPTISMLEIGSKERDGSSTGGWDSGYVFVP